MECEQHTSYGCDQEIVMGKRRPLPPPVRANEKRQDEEQGEPKPPDGNREWRIV